MCLHVNVRVLVLRHVSFSLQRLRSSGVGSWKEGGRWLRTFTGLLEPGLPCCRQVLSAGVVSVDMVSAERDV